MGRPIETESKSVICIHCGNVIYIIKQAPIGCQFTCSACGIDLYLKSNNETEIL